jgi:hypothetical protein
MMESNNRDASKKPSAPPSHTYSASIRFVALFYLALVAWSVVCVILLHSVIQKFGLSPLVGLIMIAFILVYTWYFSLAFSYRIEVWAGGDIRLSSFRRTITTHAERIPYVNMPRLYYGFIKFRLKREMGYLFANTNDASLKKVLSVISAANPDMRFKNR